MIFYPDTNAILRYLLADNYVQFKKASAFFNEVLIGHTRAVILESVIVECVHVLTKFYGVTRVETAAKLAAILNYRGVVNQDRQELARALTLYGETSLDIVDCILFMKTEGTERSLFSFDEKLNKMQKKRQ